MPSTLEKQRTDLTEECLRIVQGALNDGVLHDRLKHTGVWIETLIGVRFDDRLLLLTIAEKVFTLESDLRVSERDARTKGVQRDFDRC